VNGRPTGGGERFQLRFEGERMSGRFGCNSVSGGYSVNGSSMTAGNLAMTRMACPDMSFETDAARILSRPVELNFAHGDRLTMVNAVGSITLRRQY
jgi:heat shock protein HslJ